MEKISGSPTASATTSPSSVRPMARSSELIRSAHFPWAFVLTARTSGLPTPIPTMSRSSVPAMAQSKEPLRSVTGLMLSCSTATTCGSPTRPTIRCPYFKQVTAPRLAHFLWATLPRILPSTAPTSGCPIPSATLSRSSSHSAGHPADECGVEQAGDSAGELRVLAEGGRASAVGQRAVRAHRELRLRQPVPADDRNGCQRSDQHQRRGELRVRFCGQSQADCPYARAGLLNVKRLRNRHRYSSASRRQRNCNEI